MPRRERPRVLLIEDDPAQLDLYAMVLEDEFDVLGATLGQTGYELACTARPDAIVVDVILPDVDGLTICDRLRANPATASVPIIVLTGNDNAYARAQFKRSELTGVLLKPCDADRFVSALHTAVDRASL